MTPNLPWTGERMIPHASDIATELFHWQRYLYFHPWYRNTNVIDAASGEGYGTNFASIYAASATGVDISIEATEYSSKRYNGPQYVTGDVCEFDYSAADLVTSFETIEHLPDPSAFLKALQSCTGKIVISTPNRKTHSPGNSLSDKPLNPHHTIEWTPNEFAELVRNHFPDRQVRFLSQEGRWPGLIREGLDDDAMYCIAVIGDGELPQWPRLGLAIPTKDNFAQLQETILGISRYYPGEVEFAVVSNGSNQETLELLRQLAAQSPHMVRLVELDRNHGYGVGANKGLDNLWQDAWFDYFGVVNDDVIPSVACTIEMVNTFGELAKQGLNPGIIGPMSNKVNGRQQVDVGAFSNLAEMMIRAEKFHRENYDSASQVSQVRGLYFLMSPACLSDIGGFDPRFGLGNFEDDDLNLRCKLAGYTLWLADAAFLYHHGSQTFQKLGIDYASNIERNQQVFAWKWDLSDTSDWPFLQEAPEEVDLFVPLCSEQSLEFKVDVHGEPVDLINQASDMEFVAWVHQRLLARHRNVRREIVRVIMDAVIPTTTAVTQGSESEVAA
ncbi:MAG: glycosyltransferase [Fimbriimonadaceae bacterium]